MKMKKTILVLPRMSKIGLTDLSRYNIKYIEEINNRGGSFMFDDELEKLLKSG